VALNDEVWNGSSCIVPLASGDLCSEASTRNSICTGPPFTSGSAMARVALIKVSEAAARAMRRMQVLLTGG
jgi:hypothetical protein